MCLCALVFVLVASCGGGGGGSSPPTPPPVTDNPPTVTIMAPSNGSTVSGPVMVNASVNDDKGVSRVDFFIDNTLLVSRTAAPWSTQWDSSVLPNGTRTIKVMAIDTANQEGSREVTVTSNNAPPPPPDRDGDGVADASDNCPNDANTNQANFDGDSSGDVCDNDDDNDGVVDTADACPLDPNDTRDVDGDGVCDSKDTEPVVYWIQSSDYAVFDDELPTKEFTITVKAYNVEFVRLRFARHGIGLVGSAINLYDNGQNGDVAAGDHLYTRTTTLGVSPLGVLRQYNGLMEDLLPSGLTPYDSNGGVVTGSYITTTGLGIGVVSRSAIATVTTRTPSVSTTDSMANVVMLDFINGYHRPNLQSVTKAFCNLFPGATFDFLVVTNHHRSTDDAGAFGLTVSNNTDGIGLSRYDGASSYGCPGLQHIAYQNIGAPSGWMLVHELGHRYAVYLNNSTLQLTYHRLNGVLSWDPVHWGHSTLCRGQMNSAGCLVEQPNGSFRVDPPTVEWPIDTFNDWELYLWGLKPREQIIPQWFVTTPGTVVNYGATLSPNDVRYVSIDDVVTTYGSRVPTQGQTSYRIGFIAVSRNPLSEAAFVLESIKARHFGSQSPASQPRTPPSMWAATQGLATFTTSLP